MNGFLWTLMLYMAILMPSSARSCRLLTNGEGSCNALAGLQGSPGVGIGSNPHSKPPRQHGGSCSEQEGNSRETSVVDGWGATDSRLVSVELESKTIL